MIQAPAKPTRDPDQAAGEQLEDDRARHLPQPGSAHGGTGRDDADQDDGGSVVEARLGLERAGQALGQRHHPQHREDRRRVRGRADGAQQDRQLPGQAEEEVRADRDHGDRHGHAEGRQRQPQPDAGPHLPPVGGETTFGQDDRQRPEAERVGQLGVVERDRERARPRRAARRSAGRSAATAGPAPAEIRTARIAASVTTAPTSTNTSSWWTSKVMHTSCCSAGRAGQGPDPIGRGGSGTPSYQRVTRRHAGRATGLVTPGDGQNQVTGDVWTRCRPGRRPPTKGCDPMYGDTAAGRKRVAQLREQSGDIRALAARLVSQAEAVPWHGKAADAMRERIKERANHLRAAAAHHETAAESLAKHLGEVDTPQGGHRHPLPQGHLAGRGRPHARERGRHRADGRRARRDRRRAARLRPSPGRSPGLADRRPPGALTW